MQNIKLFLTLSILYTLVIIPSLQAASSSALMKAAEYTRATSIKPIDVQITQEAPNSKVITISRNGSNILSFNAQLLADHDFSGIIEFGQGSDAAYIEAAKALFNGLNSHQINVLVKALNEDANPLTAQAFIDNLDPNDLGWLANKANFADIKNIFKALTLKLTNQPGLAFSLYNSSKINKDVSQVISDKIDMQSVETAILHRIPYRIIFDGGARAANFNSNNSQVLITTNDRVILVSIQNPVQQTILYIRNPQLDGNTIKSSKFNTDDSQILITTNNRVVLVSTQKPNQQTVLYTKDQQLDGDYIKSSKFNTDNSQVLIKTDNRVVLISTQNPDQHKILYTREQNEDERFHYHIFQSETFNSDSSQVLINTNDRVILVSTQNPVQQTILYIRNPELDGRFIGSSEFNTDSSQVLINTNNRVILVSTQNPDQQTVLYTTNDFITTAKFSANNGQVLIRTKNKVILVSTQNPDQQIILSTFDTNFIKLSSDSRQVLISTKDRIILVSTQNPEQQIVLYTRDQQLDGYYMYPKFNNDSSRVLIITDNRIICQINYQHLLNRLHLDQKIFLTNVAKAWEYNEPYIIQSDEEREIYESLPEELKQPELFKVINK